jgi:hypothetical protein
MLHGRPNEVFFVCEMNGSIGVATVRGEVTGRIDESKTSMRRGQPSDAIHDRHKAERSNE